MWIAFATMVIATALAMTLAAHLAIDGRNPDRTAGDTDEAPFARRSPATLIDQDCASPGRPGICGQWWR